MRCSSSNPDTTLLDATPTPTVVVVVVVAPPVTVTVVDAVAPLPVPPLPKTLPPCWDVIASAASKHGSARTRAYTSNMTCRRKVSGVTATAAENKTIQPTATGAPTVQPTCFGAME